MPFEQRNAESPNIWCWILSRIRIFLTYILSFVDMHHILSNVNPIYIMKAIYCLHGYKQQFNVVMYGFRKWPLILSANICIPNTGHFQCIFKVLLTSTTFYQIWMWYSSPCHIQSLNMTYCSIRIYWHPILSRIMTISVAYIIKYSHIKCTYYRFFH